MYEALYHKVSISIVMMYNYHLANIALRFYHANRGSQYINFVYYFKKKNIVNWYFKYYLLFDHTFV